MTSRSQSGLPRTLDGGDIFRRKRPAGVITSSPPSAGGRASPCVGNLLPKAGPSKAPLTRNELVALALRDFCGLVRHALNEAKVARMRPSKMSEQFFYVHLKFIPKIVSLEEPILRQREVVVEVSKSLVQHRQSELSENPGEKAIALDIARRAALGTFPTVAERILGLYDEEAPSWHEHRHHVMNERPCDNEENSTRAWRIV